MPGAPLVVCGSPVPSLVPLSPLGSLSSSVPGRFRRWLPFAVGTRCRGWSSVIIGGSPRHRLWSPVAIGDSLLSWVPPCRQWLSLAVGGSVVGVGSPSLLVVPLCHGGSSSPVVVPRSCCQGWCPVVMVGLPSPAVDLLGWWRLLVIHSGLPLSLWAPVSSFRGRRVVHGFPVVVRLPVAVRGRPW